MPVICVQISKVCNFDLYRPVRAVHTGPLGYRYANRPLLGGSVKNRPSTVDFGRRRPIEEEIDRRRSIEREIDGRLRKKKGRRGNEKKEGKKEYLARTPSSPACRRRSWVAHGRGRIFSHARRRSVSPRGEKDRGDVADVSPHGKKDRAISQTARYGSHTGTDNMSVHRYGPISQTLVQSHS
ncbi:hypothetical protein BHE74_00002599 [Ensete ventricosum]|nr:hypothetical protein BHE74_00002599 [Ensete ventricosum]